MGIIHQLDLQTANSIAAGEVVERPASVVKELAENALDAGASTITVAITGGGILDITVIDNGRGMASDDALIAFSRHATSKIRQIEDLDSIGTLGFRGEALASIAAVARVTLKTRQSGEPMGTEVRIEGGQRMRHGPAGCPEGTSIQVEQLFYNTPARFKFLKKDSTEAAAIAETVERLILARPDVSFRLLTNGQEVLHSPGNNDLLSAIYAVYGRKQAATCIPVSGQNGPVRIGGFIARPEGARNNRSGQTVLVNGRWIRSKTVTAAIDEAYKTRLMKGRFAFTVLQIDLPQELIDVNVHPQKLEIRFWKDGEVFTAVYQSIVASLNEHAGVLPDESEAEEQQGRATQTTAEPIQVHFQSLFESKQSNQIETQINQSEVHKNRTEGQKSPIIEQDKTDHTDKMSGHADDLSRLEYPVPTPDTDRLKLAELQPQSQHERLATVPDGLAAEMDQTVTSGLLKAAQLTEARVIGTLFRTYILLELSDELIMIDQHAAHEKIIYERLRDARQSQDAKAIQPMLVPLTVRVTASERIVLESEQPFFESIGFQMEAFGANALLIRGIPDLKTAQIDPEAALRTALQMLTKGRLNDAQALDELLYQIACKAAVKAHDRLSDLEIRRLITDLGSLENPYTCPHGRPVIIRISRLELEKKFKRVL